MNKGAKKKRIFWISILVFFVSVLVAVTIFLAVFIASDSYVKFDSEKLLNVANNLTILDNNDEVLSQTAYVDNREITDVDSISEYTLNAFISIEDRRFYSHNGVDIKGIFRAIINNVKSGSLKEGASTISQQLIKNTHLVNEKTIKRKINESFLAFQLEKNYTKSQILEMYLNTIYFGGNCFGIESASKTYFGKSASLLSLAESATLAGLLKAPNNYSPIVNPEKCILRRNIVLNSMVKNGFIDTETAQQALSEPLQVNRTNTDGNSKDYIYAVLHEACEILNMTPSQLYSSGLTVSTYFDGKAQEFAENAINQDDTLAINDTQPQKSILLIDNETGGISAFYSISPFDALTQKRQIGSVIKPISVYAPALDTGKISVCTPVLDDKVSFGGYIPKNYGGKYSGWTTIENSVVKSLNVPAIKVLNDIGIDTSVNYLRKNGIEVSQEDKNLTLAVGALSGGIDIVALANSYHTLANNGNYTATGTIKSLSNDKGVIYAKSNAGNKVFSESTAFLTTSMLQKVAKNGTARKLAELPFQVAAKTGTSGTSEFNTDALICGYTTKHTFAVVISESYEKLPTTVSGGVQPAEICRSFLSSLYADETPQSFEKPDTITEVEIDGEILTNQHKIVKAGQNSKKRVTYFFSLENSPKEQKESIKEKPTLSVSYNEDFVKITSKGKNYYSLVRKSQDEERIICNNFNGTFFDKEIVKGQTYQYKLCTYAEGQQITFAKTKIGIPKN